MRTTITLDDDLAMRLERHRTERGLTFKEIVNDTLRVGLASLEQPRSAQSAEIPVTRPLPLGRRLIADVDDIADALAIAEGEDFR